MDKENTMLYTPSTQLSTIEDVLLDIIQQNGIEALNNHLRIISIIRDILPNESHDTTLLKMFFDIFNKSQSYLCNANPISSYGW